MKITPLVHGFAPGKYYLFCDCCGEEHMGDKRATVCEPCSKKISATVGDEPFDEFADMIVAHTSHN